MKEKEKRQIIGACGNNTVIFTGDSIKVANTDTVIFIASCDILEAIRIAKRNLKGFIPFEQ